MPPLAIEGIALGRDYGSIRALDALPWPMWDGLPLATYLDRGFEADDAREELAARADARDDVRAQLVLDGARAVARGFEFPESAGAGHGCEVS